MLLSGDMMHMVVIKLVLSMRSLTLGELNLEWVIPCGKSMSPLRFMSFSDLLPTTKFRIVTIYSKRRHPDDLTCPFRNENKYIHHLFFYCVVAQQFWSLCYEIFDVTAPASDLIDGWLKRKWAYICNSFYM